jgi:uroporphyrinogen III methyltransferase/synthase
VINSLIVDRAGKGLAVVRLKGGDPFIFGRGGEEAQEVVNAGFPVEVVPGVTSAIAVPAYAGIPLTHRDFSSTVAFVTGHEDPTKGRSDIAWDKLSTGAGTLVFLMGMGNLSRIAASLMEHGRSPETPVAVIQRGTLQEQRTVTGVLGDIAGLAEQKGLRPPSIIVVGDVVRLRKELDWFEKRPLFGKRIVVTRARDQASTFLAALSELGAECVEFPTIEVSPPATYEGMDRAIADLGSYGWVVFTSANGVRFFFDRLGNQGRDTRALKGSRVAAIGSKTAEALLQRGILPDLVPEDEFRAEAVVEAFRKEDVKGVRILLPRAAEAREVLPRELEEMGARVDVVEAYRTLRPEGDRGKVREMLTAGEIHMVTFTSSSTVRNFTGMFEREGAAFFAWMRNTAVACIGPVTAETAKKLGLEVRLVAPEYTVEGLTAAIIDYFSSEAANR